MLIDSYAMPDTAKYFTCKISFSPQISPVRFTQLSSPLLRSEHQGPEKLNLLQTTWLESGKAEIQPIDLTDVTAQLRMEKTSGWWLAWGAQLSEWICSSTKSRKELWRHLIPLGEESSAPGLTVKGKTMKSGLKVTGKKSDSRDVNLRQQVCGCQETGVRTDFKGAPKDREGLDYNRQDVCMTE